MRLCEPIEDLIHTMEREGLGGLAVTLRSYLDEGLPIDLTSGETFLKEQAGERRLRERSPREQVIAACAFVAEQIVEPYRMLREAEEIATQLSKADDSSGTEIPSTRILLVTLEFEGRAPVPAATDDEIAATDRIAKWLPKARTAMLRRLGEDDVPPEDSCFDPLDPDRGRKTVYAEGYKNAPLRKRLPKVEREDADFRREPWPQLSDMQALLELGFDTEGLSNGD